jgi:hypothetical protein
MLEAPCALALNCARKSINPMTVSVSHRHGGDDEFRCRHQRQIPSFRAFLFVTHNEEQQAPRRLYSSDLCGRSDVAKWCGPLNNDMNGSNPLWKMVATKVHGRSGGCRENERKGPISLDSEMEGQS